MRPEAFVLDPREGDRRDVKAGLRRPKQGCRAPRIQKSTTVSFERDQKVFLRREARDRARPRIVDVRCP